MNDNIPDKDKKDWENFLSNKEKLPNKDINFFEKKKQIIRTIDLHGYTLIQANKKIESIINKSYLEGVNKLIVITGKGIHSKNESDPFVSKDLSILKYSVPNFIKNNSDLMQKIIRIDFDSVNSSSKGSFDINLKSKKNK